MKKLIIILAAALLLCCSACSNGSDKQDSSAPAGASSSSESTESAESAESSKPDESTASEVSHTPDVFSSDSSIISEPAPNAISYKVKDAEKPTGKSSSTDAPLSLNEWGTAAKLNLKDNTYTNVPVRLVSVKRGENIYSELKETVGSSRYLFEPRDNEEYLLCEYEICLDGFPVPEGGTLCDITGGLTGTNGEMIKLSTGSYWGSSTVSLDEQTYYYDGVIHSMICSPIPKEVKDYLIVLGEYGETQAFFKPE